MKKTISRLLAALLLLTMIVSIPATLASAAPKKTATPKPTATPKRTATPKPAATPKPTATPKPSSAPVDNHTQVRVDYLTLLFKSSKLYGNDSKSGYTFKGKLEFNIRVPSDWTSLSIELNDNRTNAPGPLVISTNGKTFNSGCHIESIIVSGPQKIIEGYADISFWTADPSHSYLNSLKAVIRIRCPHGQFPTNTKITLIDTQRYD